MNNILLNKPVKKRIFDSKTVMITVTLAAMGIYYFLFLIFPIIYAFIGSFFNWNPMMNKMNFIGLDNYVSVFQTPVFYKALINTLVFTFVVTLLRVVLGLMLAVFVDSLGFLKSFFRMIYFLPVVSSIVAISLVWVWIFEPTSGILNQILNVFGVPTLGWLKDQYLALPAIMITTVWKDVGFAMVFYLAGLNNIPSSLYEAANVDGATGLQKFFHIQLPMLAPQTMLIAVTGIITYMQLFDQIFMMTEKAGPNNATISLVYFLYDEAFNNFRFGTAAVIAFIIFLMTFVFSLIQMRMQKQSAN